MMNEIYDQIFDVMVENGMSDPRPNKCYDCPYAKPAFGSGHHIHCTWLDDRELEVLIAGIVVTTGIVPSSLGTTIDFGRFSVNVPFIHGKKHGVEKGWFSWPINFDPVWLEWCFLKTQSNKKGETDES